MEIADCKGNRGGHLSSLQERNPIARSHLGRFLRNDNRVPRLQDGVQGITRPQSRIILRREYGAIGTDDKYGVLIGDLSQAARLAQVPLCTSPGQIVDCRRIEHFATHDDVIRLLGNDDYVPIPQRRVIGRSSQLSDVGRYVNYYAPYGGHCLQLSQYGLSLGDGVELGGSLV